MDQLGACSHQRDRHRGGPVVRQTSPRRPLPTPRRTNCCLPNRIWRDHVARKNGPLSRPNSHRSRDRDWYPYYAGFTEAFIEFVLDTQLRGAQAIIDPWNGTGTTTAVCEKRGLSSIGIDINPALTVIARGRLLRSSARDDLQQLTSEIVAAAEQSVCLPVEGDLLETWVQPDAASRIRRIQRAIHSLTAETNSSTSPEHIVSVVANLSDATCFYYCALFAVVRDLLRRYRSTNPMWVKLPATRAHRLNPSWATLSEAFTVHASTLRGRLAPYAGETGGRQARVMTGDATALPFDSDRFDAAITSPPYATRIDYVKGTLPELAVLGADASFLRRLRRTVTGTPVVKNVGFRDRRSLESDTGKAVLDSVSMHYSKGSRSYYLPWLKNYFEGLQAGISELVRTVATAGPICVVVQDSYYKECRVGLQEIVVELMGAAGRSLGARYDHPAPAPRQNAGLGSKRTSVRRTSESLLVFR